jgi:hypothetical protein
VKPQFLTVRRLKQWEFGIVFTERRIIPPSDVNSDVTYARVKTFVMRLALLEFGDCGELPRADDGVSIIETQLWVLKFDTPPINALDCVKQ